MNSISSIDTRLRWSRILTTAGSIGVLVGALDPLEGSLLILPGSGLLALGTFLGLAERHLFMYRAVAFGLIAVGVGAMWGISTMGGFGGDTGRPMWWGALVLPYLIGWSMLVCGPGNQRWVHMMGIVVGLWYLGILVMTRAHSTGQRGEMSAVPGTIIGALGLLTIVGCVIRLRRRG